ncbi:MAG TPA: bacillithiol system redox-active protein YtxJ, partial [Longimicrobium sp.]|nr:bacillithiol system redox-active protein YtxJ [Longimicrobium sp.]
RYAPCSPTGPARGVGAARESHIVEGGMKEMRSRGDVDAALGEDTAILFKHSTRCPISAAARAEMQRFMELNPDEPVYCVDVNDSAEASRYLAEKTGIEHHSPQVIVTRGGQPEWHASHFDIKADEVGRRAGRA